MDVEQIYKAYPRHRDKRFALTSIEKALRRIRDGETGRRMRLEEAEVYLYEKTAQFSASFAGQRGVLTPYCATWMNRGGYMDDPEEWELISPEEHKQLRQTQEANVGVWRPQ
jgi:hypothetical protein